MGWSKVSGKDGSRALNLGFKLGTLGFRASAYAEFISRGFRRATVCCF